MADLSRIQFKRTSTKGRKPDASTMNPGELAINLADQYLLTKNDSGTIINLSCPPVYDRDVTMAGKVKGNNYILSKTANYLEDQTARDLNYFGAFRTNGLDGLLELTLNVPHSSGVQHGRGFTFQYGHTGSRVETYGYNKEGQKAFSYKMYHEGDKPTPSELNVYSKQEIDRMFIKNVKMSVPSGDATRGYFKIATAMIPQNGRMAFLRIYGGNGYNVNSYDQVDFLEIVIRGGNNNPKGVSIAAYRRNSLNVHEVFAINTSGDNYDIYVNYGRYTDNVIVEFGKTVDVALTVHDVPEFSATKPATGTKFDARVITMFNTENKAGTLMFDNNGQGTYDIISLNNSTDSNKKYLRKFRSKSAETIWHEVVEGSVYRLATGFTDTADQLKIDFNGVTVNRLFVKGNNAIRMERRDGQSNYIEFFDYRSGANRRQGYLGYGDGTTNTVQLVNELTEGNNSVRLDENGQVSLSTGKTKIVYTNGEYVAAYANAFRMIYGNYGAFWRNDGGKIYLLSTAENDKFGSWNGNRPFIYYLTTGKVTLGGDGNEGALVLERDSRAARFAGDIYVGKGMLTFDAGRLNSRDYFRFNHWGDSNNGRDNILQIEDSQGAHFITERAMGTGNITARFKGFVRVESGEIAFDANRGSQSQFTLHTWGNEQRKQVFECKDATSYHWYTERTQGGTGPILFSMAGSLNVGSNITTTGADITFKRAGNKHIWFRDPDGLELGLMYCDDAGVIRFRGQKQAQAWKLADKMIHLESGSVGGSDKGLIRGSVAGGSWAGWRDRASGLQVDCPQSTNSAHNIWKATHWGQYHIAAMGVHVPDGTIGNAMVRMHVHDATFDFSATGDFQAGRNGNFNDVYIRSDARLKINKEEYKENATDKVNRLTVYTYDKVKSLTDRTVIAHEVGIIAQDLEKELPEAVTTSKVGDPDKPEEILTISNSAVNALLIKAFQEMSEELKAVKAELAELKKN
ncbi:tail fiber [Escherichia phage vB_ESM-pEJ01]|nr:tail fiber [Escherichia phage vB_ESM-pEJ01]